MKTDLSQYGFSPDAIASARDQYAGVLAMLPSDAIRIIEQHAHIRYYEGLDNGRNHPGPATRRAEEE